MNRPAIIVTGADLAAQALALLQDFHIVYAGKAPTDDDLVALCRTHDPVADFINAVTADVLARVAALSGEDRGASSRLVPGSASTQGG